MTKMIHKIVGSTNALTNVMTIEASIRTVATILTGLNIFSSCVLKPIRKPVPMREMIPPTAKRAKACY